jgi:hypothetical protein
MSIIKQKGSLEVIDGTLRLTTLGTGTTITSLGIDSNGFVVSAGTDTNTFTTGATLNGTILEFDRNDLSNAYNVDLTSILDYGSLTATTTTINFTGQTIYYDAITPSTGNISEDLTGAKLGLIQKIYHNDVVEPTYPAGWVLMGDAIYFTSTLNIIYAEWAGGSRVEYWYVQEQ